MLQRLRLALFVTAVLGLSGLATAQTIPFSRPSHVPIPGGGLTPEAADQFLKTRLQSAQTAGELEKLAREILANPDRYKLTQEDRPRLLRGGASPANPEMQRKLEEILNRPGQGIDPEQARQLKAFLDRHKQPPVPATGTENEGSGPRPAGSPTPARNDPGAIPSPETPPPSRGGEPPSLRPDPAQPSAVDDSLLRGLRRIGDSLSGTPLAESDAFRRMVLSLDRVPTGTAKGSVDWGRHRNQIGKQISALGDRLPNNVSLPRLKWSGGEGRLPRRPGGGFAVPAVSASPTSGEEAFPLILILVALGVAAAAVFLLSRRRGKLRLLQALHSRPLGPWPVRPEAVRTREELVQAFDYLALLLLGSAARSWNHRDIAASLDTAPARGDAAERLAGLYERARYAPADDTLPESELAVAQRDLTFLAGAAAA